MIDFKEVQIEDKRWADPIIRKANLRGSHYNFSTIFTWAKINNYRIAEVHGFLVVKLFEENQAGYYFPVGEGDIKAVLDLMIQDAADNGHQFRLYALSPEDHKVTEELYPGRFTFEYERDYYDYVYELDKLVTLSGKKLHTKRNHINKFKRTYSNWQFEILSDRNMEDCIKMNEQWCKENGCAENGELQDDYCATRRYFKYYKDLGVDGALIRAEGKVVAFTIGEILNSDTYVIHVEKALRDVEGGYSMINREFAEYVKGKYPFIVLMNREEDMGDEGLRKAKESYYPDRMEEKCWAELIK